MWFSIENSWITRRKMPVTATIRQLETCLMVDFRARKFNPWHKAGVSSTQCKQITFIIPSWSILNRVTQHIFYPSSILYIFIYHLSIFINPLTQHKLKPPAAKWWPLDPHRSNHWIPGEFPKTALPHTGRHSLKQWSSSQFLTPTLRKDVAELEWLRVALRERVWSEHVPIIYPFWVVSLLTICGGSHGFTLKEKQPILLYTLTFQCNCVKIWIFRCSTVGFTDASSKVMLKSKLCQGIDLMFSLWLLKHGWKKKHGANFASDVLFKNG